ETVYRITVPTDRPGALDTAIIILAEMAHQATFDATEARAEAGVVFEEWRSRQGAGARFSEQRNALLLADSRYPTRAPIGDTTVLRRFDLREMRRFYETWYRPDLMAIVVVGDIDEPSVKKLVNKHFGSIPVALNQKKRSTFTVPLANHLRAATLADDEATETRLSLFFPHDRISFKTVSDYRAWLLAELWREILTARLNDIADTPDSPILSAYADTHNPARPLEAEYIGANVSDKNVLRALELLATEINRLKQHGPTERELTERTEAFVKSQWRESEWSRTSSDLADSYVTKYIDGDVVLSRAYYYNLAERVIPTVHPADVMMAARHALIDSSALITVTHPVNMTTTSVTSDQLIEKVRSVASVMTSLPVEPPDSVKLVPNLPTAGRIVSETTRREIDVSELTLSNGMHVILKPTEFTDDHIEFRMFGSGGASLASPADFESAYLSDAVISTTGIGPLTGTRLDRLLNSSSLSFTQSVSNDAIRFDGEVAPRDIEQLFQVLYLNFTAPRADTAAFRRFRERMLAGTALRSSNPDDVFEDSANAISMQHDRRAMRYTSSFYNAVTLPKALSFWNARMSNAASFTLVMTGDFTMTRVRPLIEQYLASLPGGVREQSRDDGIRFPAGIVDRRIYAGVGPRAKTRIMLSGPISYTMETSERASLVRDVAQLALEQRLRETMGGTYGVDVGFSVNLVAPARYRFDIEFEAAADRIDSLATVAFAELKRLGTVGPSEVEMTKVRTSRLRDFDNSGESNQYWAGELSQHARLSWSLDSITTHPERIKNITTVELRDICALLLDTSHYARLTMYPKSLAPVRKMP
ncbi:MAG: insulinase family protein, partial [Gemmatimonadaceae bacterium]